jgi:transcriptional regulator of acetoin/glycerol metabolism
MLQEQDGGEAPVRLSADAEQRLRAYAWPGNLRELHNAIAYASAVCEGGVIEVHDLPETVLRAVTAGRVSADGDGDGDAEAGAPLCAEAQLLLQYLRAARWNVSAVAHQMGVARMTVYRRMRRWGIEGPR